MKPGGGKRKGSSYERKVCKKLSLWVTNGQRSDVFWRTAMSGGRRKTLKGRERFETVDAGDITAVSEEGRLLTSLFCVEAKHLKEMHFERCLFNPHTTSAAFVQCWDQTVEQARQATAQLRTIGIRTRPRLPMMCVHVHGRSEILVVSDDGWDVLMNLNGWNDETQPVLIWPRLDAVVFPFDDVLMLGFAGIRRAYEE